MNWKMFNVFGCSILCLFPKLVVMHGTFMHCVQYTLATKCINNTSCVQFSSGFEFDSCMLEVEVSDENCVIHHYS